MTTNRPASLFGSSASAGARRRNTTADLQELWTRIVFNMHVSNTDDHLRNHGFLLDPALGWHLPPAYDINPIPDSEAGLKLNVSGVSNDLDIALAMKVAPYLGLPAREIHDMAYAFRLADAGTA